MISHYEGALLEQVRDDLQRFMEAMAGVPGDIRTLKSDVAELKADIQVMKALYADHSATLNNHEGRITALEQ